VIARKTEIKSNVMTMAAAAPEDTVCGCEPEAPRPWAEPVTAGPERPWGSDGRPPPTFAAGLASAEGPGSGAAVMVEVETVGLRAGLVMSGDALAKLSGVGVGLVMSDDALAKLSGVGVGFLVTVVDGRAGAGGVGWEPKNPPKPIV
jgi:hypothetical protein